jgi:hypothetical protein
MEAYISIHRIKNKEYWEEVIAYFRFNVRSLTIWYDKKWDCTTYA